MDIKSRRRAECLQDDYSLVNPNLSNHVLTRFSQIVEVPDNKLDGARP